MLELFSRVTGSGGGTCEASLFNGLRVRMVSHGAGVGSIAGLGLWGLHSGLGLGSEASLSNGLRVRMVSHGAGSNEG